MKAEKRHLLLSEERLNAIREEEKSDPLMADLLAQIRVYSESYLVLPPIQYKSKTDPNMLHQVRGGLGRIITCAFEYRLSRNKRFAQAAVRDLLTASSFPDWNPAHFLDTAEMSFGVAVGYSWLKDILSAEDRATIENALVRNALSTAPIVYAPFDEGKRLCWAAFEGKGTGTNNWNFVCNGGMLAAAIALKDKEPELAQRVVDGAMRSLPLAMKYYEPDGAWPEGPGYWEFGTQYLVYSMALLTENFGEEPEIKRMPGFCKTLAYVSQIFGPSQECFNFADARAATQGCGPAACWLAQHDGSTFAIEEVRKNLAWNLGMPLPEYSKSLPPGEPMSSLVFSAIWLPQRPVEQTDARQLPLDVHFRGDADLAFFRSEWNNPNALWIGFKGGVNNAPHGHLDLGTFVLEANGVRWAVDLGGDSYELPDYWDGKQGGKRWSYYRLNNFGHNTIFPESTLQDAFATAPIVVFESTPKKALAVLDLTPAYPGFATKILRGMAMLDRAQVLVQDDVTGIARSAPLHWQMLTPAEIGLSTDARTATLFLDGRKLRATLLNPAEARFSIGSTQPSTAVEEQNRGTSALRITVAPEGQDIRIAVLFTPIDADGPQLPPPEIYPVESWTHGDFGRTHL